MVRRSAIFSFRLLGGVIAALVVLALVALWRLTSGPVSLEILNPYLQRALTPRGGEITVEVTETELRLDRREAEIDLVVLGVRAIDQAGETVITLPEVEVDLDLWALVLHQVVAPTRLMAQAPALSLARDEHGRIGLSGMTVGDRPPGIELPQLVAFLLDEPQPGRPLSYLRSVEIAGGQLLMHDQASGETLRARAAELTMVRRAEGVDARLDFAFGAGARVALNGRLGRTDRTITFAAQVTRLVPTDVAGLLPSMPFDPAGFDLLLEGRIQGQMDLDGVVSPIEVFLASEGGVVDLPGMLARPLSVTAFELRAGLAGDLGGARIDDLLLQVNGASLRGEGDLGWRGGDFAVRAEVEAGGARAAELDALWPPLLARDARQWVMANIDQGFVPEATLKLDLRPSDFGRRPLRDDALEARFDFQDMQVRYFKTMPPIQGGSGQAFATGQTMTFEVEEGRSEGLEIEDGTVSITGIGIKGRDTTQLEVEAHVTGPIPAALALIDREPLGFASKLGIEPAATAGQSRTELRIGVPLHKGLDEDEIRVGALATLERAAARGLLGRFDLTDGTLGLEVDREVLEIFGEARIDGVPLTIEWSEFFDDSAEVERAFRLRGRVDERALAAFGLTRPAPLQGSAFLDAQGTGDGGRQRVNLSLDLEQLEIAVQDLGWRKDSGAPGSLEAVLMLQEGRPVTIERFTLDTVDLVARGDAVLALEAPHLRALTLAEFSLGAQQGVARLRHEPGHALEATIDASSLDLTPLMERDDEPDPTPRTPLALEVAAERALIEEGTLYDLEASLHREETGWRSASLTARLDGGGDLNLSLGPQADVERLRVTSSDVGTLLNTLDQTRRVVGGQLALDFTIVRQIPDLKGEGRLVIEDFTLLDAPILARLLTVASFTGIDNLLGGEGIAVDRLEIPFAIDGRRLALDKSVLGGSQLGLTMQGTIDLATDTLDLAGTIVPLYGLNWAIGQIPVIGDFLAGSEGEGAFAATYRVRGSRSDPEVSVNPLSFLAPGFIRELFAGFAAGTHEAPEMLDKGEE